LRRQGGDFVVPTRFVLVVIPSVAEGGPPREASRILRGNDRAFGSHPYFLIAGCPMFRVSCETSGVLSARLDVKRMHNYPKLSETEIHELSLKTL
jgi:hypothetical protein